MSTIILAVGKDSGTANSCVLDGVNTFGRVLSFLESLKPIIASLKTGTNDYINFVTVSEGNKVVSSLYLEYKDSRFVLFESLQDKKFYAEFLSLSSIEEILELLSLACY